MSSNEYLNQLKLINININGHSALSLSLLKFRMSSDPDFLFSSRICMSQHSFV